MNRRKTLTLLGGGLTFGGLYGVNSLTQPAFAVENVEITDSIEINEDEIDNLAFEFTSFELSAVNSQNEEITVELQGRLNEGEDYETLDNNTITLINSEYNNEDFSGELGQFSVTGLDLNTELIKDGDEQEVELQIIIAGENINFEHESKINISVVEPSYPVLQSFNTTSNNENEDVIEISDWNDLDNVRNDLTGDYVLVNDLDENTDGYDGIGDDFEPIGDSPFGDRDDDEFIGSLDGQGYEITGLTIDMPSENFVGLIGNNDGTVENIGVVNADITAGSFVGVLTGHNGDGTTGTDATVSNSYATGSVTGDRQVGGLVGDNGGEISESYATVDVTGNVDVGGFMGRCTLNGAVSKSYATGSVTGDDDVGGLIGNNNNDNSEISKSYATGSVTGERRVGGLVGRDESFGSIISKSYAAGDVTGEEDVGGLIGTNNNATISDSYWDTESSGQDTSDGGTGLTTEKMQGSEAETNMDGFDFDDVWDTVG